MKLFTRFLVFALAIAPGAALASPVASTLGNNLTAYNPNGNAGAINNNTWNNLTNPRGGGGNTTTATADFGNCNSVILRCAQPKCANGGCTSMDIATPIVSGCVMSNNACKQYADDGLIETIAAQLVAQSTAKSNAAAAAAANAAAAQSNQQLQQMQYQMQEMQREMAAQNQETVAQLQAALEEQKQQTAQAIAEANAANAASAAAQSAAAATGASVSSAENNTTVMDGLTAAQQLAAQSGVSPDILAREQIAGQILSKIENAQAAMKNVQAAMQDAFTYAGCDSKGDNCTGPKRVTVFKQKAMAFFTPYDEVLDEIYEALELAQSVGVDISDIYMLLSGSCNRWGEYLCNGGKQTVGGKEVWARYDITNCPKDGGPSVRKGFSRGSNPECYSDTTIPPEDSTACTPNRALDDMEKVQRNFLFADNGDADENIRVGCMSTVLQNSKLFRNRRNSQAIIDIDTLQRIISQDAPTYSAGNPYLKSSGDNSSDKLKYCALTNNGYMELERAVMTKKLPSRICVRDETLTHVWETGGQITVSTSEAILNKGIGAGGSNGDYTTKDVCERADIGGTWNDGRCECKPGGVAGVWNNGICETWSGKTSNATTIPNTGGGIGNFHCQAVLKGRPVGDKCYCGYDEITSGCCVNGKIELYCTK